VWEGNSPLQCLWRESCTAILGIKIPLKSKKYQSRNLTIDLNRLTGSFIPVIRCSVFFKREKNIAKILRNLYKTNLFFCLWTLPPIQHMDIYLMFSIQFYCFHVLAVIFYIISVIAKRCVEQKEMAELFFPKLTFL
jgi:hypothetical protein